MDCTLSVDDYIKLQKAENESEEKVSKAHFEWCKIVTQDLQRIIRRLEALEFRVDRIVREG